MSVYRIMSLSKPQLNQLQKGFLYILIRDILIKLVLTLPFMPKKLESIFVVLLKKNNLIVGRIHKHPCMDIWTFNDHYLNPLLDNLSKEANKTIVLLGDFNIDLLNFDTSEYVSTFLDDLASNSILLDQLEKVYYLFQVITQSDLGENQLSIQPLLHGIIFKTSSLNIIFCI